ncbi:MAG: hypothetical protein RLZZ111_420 [Planctomycetota bacterium]
MSARRIARTVASSSRSSSKFASRKFASFGLASSGSASACRAFFGLLLLLAALPGSRSVRAEVGSDDREFARAPSWSMPTEADVRGRLLEWLAAESAAGRVPATTAANVEASWSVDRAGESGDLLDRVMTALAQADPRCEAIRRDAGSAAATDTGWLDAADTTSFARDAVKLWLGRERVRQDRFDEGLALLADLDPAAAVDPAALLFHRAACQHWMLEADLATESLDRLLERAGEIPVRYERVARLLRSDLASLEDESLDHIARRMRDVTRRLDQGRAGPRTIAVQEGVIESLDKLIKAIEQQQQQQQQQSQASGGSGGGRGGNATPMDDSRIAGGKGPGEVTKKDVGEGDGWGKLPPHQREEALQQIGREFPAHYREAIEHYFKRLASGEEKRP